MTIRFVFIALLLALTGCICPPRTAPIIETTDHSDIRAAYEHYFQIFMAGDAATIADTIWITPGWAAFGTNIPLPDVQAVETLYTDVFAQLVAEGWDHSVALQTKVQLLNPRAALLESSFMRIDTEGSVMPPLSRHAQYLYLKVDGSWRIAALMVESDTK